MITIKENGDKIYSIQVSDSKQVVHMLCALHDRRALVDDRIKTKESTGKIIARDLVELANLDLMIKNANRLCDAMEAAGD